MGTTDIAGVKLPDSRIARDITQFVRDTASDMLFHHSARVYWWGALAGRKLGLAFDPELLYAAAMFHDARHSGAHASRDPPRAGGRRDGHGGARYPQRRPQRLPALPVRHQ